MKTLSLLLAGLGLLLATVLVARSGFGAVLGAAASVGPAGFGLALAWQGALFLVLGLAWACLRPGTSLGGLIWSRMLRDATGNCLPFSQLGGYVFGARVLAVRGVSWPRAAASTMLDVTTEFLAQLLFSGLGLALLLARHPHSALARPAAAGLGLGVLGAVGFLWAQNDLSGLLRRMVRRVAGDGRLLRVTGHAERLQAELDLIHRHPRRVLAGVGAHLAGWLGAGVGSWILYRLLGAPVDLPAALAIEALLSVALSAAFIVPGYAGVQEAALTGLGSIYGLPPGISLAVSLLRRARDLAWGVPVLLVWQALEMRRHARRGEA